MAELDATYAPSEDIVAREIEGEIIIIPLVSGIADVDDELFTLNPSAKAIWNRLDGKATLRDIVVSLTEEYQAGAGEIEKDVLGLVEELAKRKMLVEVTIV
jgi:coenzyme PQQ biosynthesis protein PqqD